MEQAKNQRNEAPVLIGTSPVIVEVLRLIDTAAESDITVLLAGENGTGKTLAARRIHSLSARRDGPFIETNCASLPETLADSELFGHERGAFTGADRQHPGKFEQAHGGTLFLDEVEELSPHVQAKLLNVIEARTVTRVGGETEVRVDVRLIVATNCNLQRMVREGRFRKDLFFRLSELTITLPPLRERRSDIPPLVSHFVKALNEEMGKRILRVSDAAMAQLIRYDWPGNVRELRNVIKRALATSSHDAVWIEDLPLLIEMGSAEEGAARHGIGTLEEAERHHIERTLISVKWKKAQAARILGITRATLDRKIAKHRLRRPVGDEEGA